MATKIKVSKAVYNFFNAVCREIVKKLEARPYTNYTTASLNAKIEEKITMEAFSNMGQRMFEQGLTVDAAASQIITLLGI